MIVDFGLGIKGRNLFYLLQVELLTGLEILVYRRNVCAKQSEMLKCGDPDGSFRQW
jgi:hypothetical protein